eukprot:gene5414-9227_t
MSGNDLKKKREHSGRIFMFTDKNDKKECQEAKKIFTEFELDSSVISEIKIDSKPHLKKIMENKSKGNDKTPQIFFNSIYFGGLKQLNEEKSQHPTSLLERIKTTLNGEPGELYQVYKKQSEIFLIQPADFHFPLPLNRTIICAVNLINQTDSYAAFKLKTTAPKRYTVKPKDGVVEPQSTIKIEVTLHQDVKDIPEDDKFRIESVRILNSNSISEKNAVNEAFNQYQKSIVKQKICCVFGITHPNMKIMQYSDYIYIEPFETEVKNENDDDEVELEQYKSFTVDNKSKISSLLPPKKEDELSKENEEKLKEQEVKHEENQIQNKVEENQKILNDDDDAKKELTNDNIEVKKEVISPRKETIETSVKPKKEEVLKEEEVTSSKEIKNEEPKKEEIKVENESSEDIKTPSEIIPDLNTNSTWGILEQDYFSPKKKTTPIDLNENFNEVKLHKTSKISILIEENKQLKKEIEKYKIELENYKNIEMTSSKITSKKEKKEKNEEEKYSLLMVVFAAMLFFLVGKVL